MSELGTAQLGAGQLGTTGNIETISLDSATTSTLSNSIDAIFALGSTLSSSSTQSFRINTIASLSLKPAPDTLGTSRLGTRQIGGVTEGFASGSNVGFGINAKFAVDLSSSSTSTLLQDLTRVLPVGLTSASDSTLSFSVVRVRVLDFESNSLSSFKLVLSEDSYEELYGETLGTAEKDTIILGDGEKQIVVLANAEID